MNIFEKAKWIWPTAAARADEYAEFVEEVNFFGRLRYSWLSALDFVRTVRLSLEMIFTGHPVPACTIKL